MVVVKRLKKLIKNYWTAEETNLFRNYRDALAGVVVLILIPVLSIVSAVYVEAYTFWDYAFPIVSIALAGMYDTYGRYDGKSPKNAKLCVRLLLDALAIFFAALSVGTESKVIPFIAPILLSFCGLLLVYEVYHRICRAILISPWTV